MSLRLKRKDWREVFPRAPSKIIDAFVADAASLDLAGITATRTRLAYALANVDHECDGYAIPQLTENINYTAKRMAEVWPNRFSSAAAVRKKYGTKTGWQKKAFDDIYGNRMGNRKGTSDGSTYIGRGGPQITGRDGYTAVGKRAGLDLVNNPELAGAPDVQPAILAAFWSWKKLNAVADSGDFVGCVKIWNGGTTGLADRRARLAGNDPIIKRLTELAGIMPALNKTTNYLELIPRPKASTVNMGLASPKRSTLRRVLGEPRSSYTGHCQQITGPLKKRIVTKSVGPFKCTGVDVAVGALKDILADVKGELPDLYEILGTAGMTCARRVKIRQPDGTIKLGKNPSNHSWGLAVDIKLKGNLDRQGDNKCYRGLLILSRYFNAAGWYWGVSFPTEDAMHFEVAESTLKRWKKEGKFD